MTTLNTIIEEEKEEFDRACGWLLNPEKLDSNNLTLVVDAPALYRDVEALLTTAMQRAYEAGRAEERERILEEVKTINFLEDITGEENRALVLSRYRHLRDTILSKITHKA